MNSSKVKEIVSVSILIVFVIGVIGITSYISKSIFYALSVDNNSYVLRDIISVDMPVINEVEAEKIGRPYNDTNVNVQISYYDSSSEKENQERSLILYDNTYMPSTGILYSSSNTFDIVSVAEGTIESIEEDETFGTILTIKHNNNLTTKYSSIKDVKVAVGDTVNAGEIIATSNTNKVTSVSENMLLFEMIYNGEYVNPENYYDKVIEEMN